MGSGFLQSGSISNSGRTLNINLIFRILNLKGAGSEFKWSQLQKANPGVEIKT